MAEAVMISLTRKGMSRQEAHELLRKLTLRSESQKQHFREILFEDNSVRSRLDRKEIEATLNPKNYLGTAVKQVDATVKKTAKERKTRGLA